MNMIVPEDVKYTSTHEWIRMKEDEFTGVVGITDYAQAKLGDVVYVELPVVGKTGEQGEPFGSIESVKAVSDLNWPVSGEVTAVNEALADAQNLVNEDPYGQGWIIEIKILDPCQLDSLLDATAYQEIAQE